jgi:hypothetical protein
MRQEAMAISLDDGKYKPHTVMPALVAGIHVLLLAAKTCMAGTSPAMARME